ncbi:MAG: hypothetical protein M3380_15225 [Chloroflexota bacterium]|nr:hypothetical protein [Chloroflexota bacterium]
MRKSMETEYRPTQKLLGLLSFLVLAALVLNGCVHPAQLSGQTVSANLGLARRGEAATSTSTTPIQSALPLAATTALPLPRQSSKDSVQAPAVKPMTATPAPPGLVPTHEPPPVLPTASGTERQAAGDTRLYLFAFQSPTVSVVDSTSAHALHQIPVTGDQAGVAVAPDGTRLYVVDGPSDGQLRVFDTTTWQIVHQEPIMDRALLLGANPISLSGDGRWLLVEHFNYETERAWLSLFDTQMERFVPFPDGANTLQLNTCQRPVRLVGRPEHSQLYVTCDGLVAALKADTLEVLWQVPAPRGHRIELVLAPDGRRLYGLQPRVATGYGFPDGHDRVTETDLRMFTWETATGRLVQEIRLSDQTPVPTATIGRSDAGYMAMAPDGTRLYVAWENWLWTLAAESLRMTGELPLPASVDGMALSIDGSELYLLPTTAGVHERIGGLWTVDTAALKLVRHASDWPPLVVPFILAAPAPVQAQMAER